jgi:hypothetical protein
MEELKPELRA